MTVQQMKDAIKALQSKGWSRVCTVMHNSPSLPFGILFIKDSEKFYLNLNTFNNLPN